MDEATSALEYLRALHLSNLMTAVFVIASTWGLVILVGRVGRTLADAAPGRRLQIRRVETLFTFVAYIAGGAGVAATLLSPKPELLLALAGSAAVAVGFSLKDLVASIFAGIVLLFDQPFQVGDRVSFGDYYGDVVRIGLRSVKIQTLGHDLVTIPNSIFLTDAVASGNSGSLSMMVTAKMHVSVEADLDRACDLLREVVATSRLAWLRNGISVSAEEVVGEDLSPKVRLTTRCYVVDVQYEKEFLTDITLRATAAFREAGIPRG